MQQKNRINLLPVDISEKIAAGEVVDRPSSIVKELVENSIDAFADTIVVEIKNGGKTYIRITDSGEGIASPEVEKAFLRHATSKIKKVEDLDAIGTLGFRGEALTSIAAVSKVEMITKTKEEKVGTRLLIEGGHTVETSSVGCPVGTTLVVRDLFYNTPARLKFMKSDASESSRIVDFVSRVALAYPDIRFRMINNGSILFATRGNGSIYENILTIYSKQTGRKLIEINEEKGDHRLFAYISPPDLHRASRRNQVYFVNGRSINSNVLEDAITDAYRERLPSGRFPLAYLFLSVPEDLLDVNIHPNKKEVRFHDNEGVAGFITTSLIKGLQSIEGLPDIKIKPFKYESTAVSDTPNIVESSNSQIVNDQVDIKQILSTKRQEIRELEDTTTRKEHSQAEPTVTIKDKTTPLDDIYPIGSIFATYILAADETRFYLIDQHAAHERILYEKLLKQLESKEKHTQLLLSPMIIDSSSAAAISSKLWIEMLINMGFGIEPFGVKTFIIKGVPSFMDMEEAEIFLTNFLDDIDEASLTKTTRIDRIITKACKSAIKANNILNMDEIRHLLKELRDTDNPLSCPHGRPTVLTLSKGDIERLFKRS